MGVKYGQGGTKISVPTVRRLIDEIMGKVNGSNKRVSTRGWVGGWDWDLKSLGPWLKNVNPIPNWMFQREGDEESMD